MEFTANEIPESLKDFPEFLERPFGFEAKSGYLDWLRWFKRSWAITLVYIAVYLVLIALLKRYMKNREKLELKKTIAAWNFGLALFSVLGTVRTLPELVRLLSLEGGFHRSACDAT